MLAPDILEQRLHAQAVAVLKKLGRVHIPGFLEEDAAHALYDALGGLPWSITYRNGEQGIEAPVASFASLNGPERAEFLHGLYEQAGRGFQHLYESFRIGAGGQMEGLLSEFFAALNSTPMLNYLRALTGDPSIAYVDARATCYRPGYFLTEHEDALERGQRLFAFELNLTPRWQPDWGGQLLFVRPDGHVAEAYTPAWNALNIFKTPQPHAISVVAPFAQGVRYAIGGWICAEKP